MATDPSADGSRYAHLDFDPEAVRVRPAATVMVVDDRPDLRVLMLKRNARSVFVGDMWVYPGGAVDPDDGGPDAGALCVGHDDASASAAMGIEAGGLAYFVAALREMFEEAGVLVARRDGEDDLIDLSPPDVAERFGRHRDAVNAGERPFLDVVADEGLRLDLSGMHHVGHWRTPLGPPRRYDTHFFLAAMPAGQTPLHDNDEAVHDEWIRPMEAVEANRIHEMVMMTPTIGMIREVAHYRSAAEALAGAEAGRELRNVRILHDVDGPDRIVLPGDVGYDTADREVEFGRIALRRPGS